MGNQTIRTVKDVLEWNRSRSRRGGSDVAEVERKRVLGLFADALGDKDLNDLTGDDLLRFVEQAGDHAAWTRRRWVITVRRPFNLATRLGVIPRNPFALVRFPAGDRGRDLTRDEYRALLRAATPQFRRVLVFLRLSGCRPGELRSLCWENLRLDVAAALLSVHKTSSVQKDKRPRRIAICRTLARLLIWLKRRSTGPRIFLNSKGRPWTCRALTKNLLTLRRRLGLGESVKLYGCRHSFATGAILAGVDLSTLAELMGHSSTKTTEWYVHLSGKADHLSLAVERATARAL